ncbi:biotin/lipoyl-containing protein [Haliovirga abyssi]|uniref:Lipoyl-binding domain-containing protein n=1 Tax=Haliovirga abyssi TaxID=2996794 RepID=A0AAU9E117_9FUSO|nr:biotin/lipoyl-containing protein [Haliovirga abyssi]BDU50055.1 hypothetical protein HLVA_06240 [Haliovirga abyssi]
MEVTEIKKLMEILNTTDVTEITLEADGTKVLLKKDMNKQKVVTKPVPAKVEKKEEVKEESEYLYSLNIGKIFYKKDIKEGTAISENEIIGYIEAIGVKTDIISDKSGIIKELLVKTGENVEFGKAIISLAKK